MSDQDTTKEAVKHMFEGASVRSKEERVAKGFVCANCLSFQPSSDAKSTFGECHRYAPQPHAVIQRIGCNRNNRRDFPVTKLKFAEVRHDDICGEWAPQVYGN